MKTICKHAYPRDLCGTCNPPAKEKALRPSDATACSGFRVTLEAVGLTKAHAMAHALRVLSLMMEEAHTKGHFCGTINGNASAKLDEIP